jgi:glycosyltransferase involved in cell wall biosynthesis
MDQPITESLVSVLILTRNEAIHIERCVASARLLTRRVFVVDSESSDGTAEIARAAGAQVFSRAFDRFADKLNWSSDEIDFPTPWVFRLDADEVLTDKLIERLPGFVAAASLDVSGIYLRRQLWFMGQWVRHGGVYPSYTMRLWRRGTAFCESRDLDEHMILRRGTAMRCELDIIDHPLCDISTWVDKHNRYSTLEARSADREEDQAGSLIKPDLFGASPQRARWLKLKVFYRLPLFVRPFLYFCYRYLFRLGFLDGTVGFIFHFMHGLWYRVLVDAKIMEARRLAHESSKPSLRRSS